ncbi:MAG: hypothetical protein ACRCTJ_01095 [Brevinema sp.]
MKFSNFLEYIKKYAYQNSYLEILVYMTDEKLTLLNKIQKNHKKLSEICFSVRGAEIGKKECRQNDIKDAFPVLIGEDTKEYFFEYQNTYISKTHKEYLRLNNWFISDHLILLRRVDSKLTLCFYQKFIRFKNI